MGGRGLLLFCMSTQLAWTGSLFFLNSAATSSSCSFERSSYSLNRPESLSMIRFPALSAVDTRLRYPAGAADERRMPQLMHAVAVRLRHVDIPDDERSVDGHVPLVLEHAGLPDEPCHVDQFGKGTGCRRGTLGQIDAADVGLSLDALRFHQDPGGIDPSTPPAVGQLLPFIALDRAFLRLAARGLPAAVLFRQGLPVLIQVLGRIEAERRAFQRSGTGQRALQAARLGAIGLG